MLSWKTIIALMLISSVFGQTSTSNITASTCASPGGYTSCYEPAEAAALKCYAEAGSDQSLWLTCGCEAAIAELSCALENCWNVVYGCEYQSVANQLVAYCFAQDVPFFPAPANAPGGCSCNLGDVIYNMSAIQTQFVTCTQQNALDYSKLTACDCCGAAGEYTAKFSICPDLDPTLDGYVGDLGILHAALPDFSICAPTLNQYDCVQDLDFPAIGSFPYLSSLPATTGTETYSTLPGTISTPLSGSTFVFTASLRHTVSTTTITAATMTATGSRTTGSTGTVSNHGQVMEQSGFLIALYMLNIMLRAYMA